MRLRTYRSREDSSSAPGVNAGAQRRPRLPAIPEPDHDIQLARLPTSAAALSARNALTVVSESVHGIGSRHLRKILP